MSKRIIMIGLVLTAVLASVIATGCNKNPRDVELVRYKYIMMKEEDRLKLPQDILDTIDAYNNKDYYKAAVGFSAILNNQSYRAMHQTAHYYLTECLDRVGLYQASMFELANILFKGPDQIYFTAALTKLLALTKETKDESVIFNVLQTIDINLFPPKFKNEMIYMRGKRLFYEGNYEAAQKEFIAVSTDSAFYAKSLYFTGIIQVVRKDYGAARKTFDAINALPDTYSDFGEASKVKEMSKLALGQFFYKAGFAATRDKYAILAKALDYYNSVDRANDDQWFEALFEKTWTTTLIDHYNTSLGTILTINSPFFAQQFLPEAKLIEAMNWYRLCKWEDVRHTVKTFRDTYEPMAKAIEEYLGANIKSSGQVVYDDLLAQYEAALNDRQSLLSLQVLTAVLNNDNKFLEIYLAIKEMEKELEILKNAPTDFRNDMYVQRFEKQSSKKLENLKKKAGNRALTQLDQIGKTLKNQLGNAYAIDFELTDSERKHLEKIELFGITASEYHAEKSRLDYANYTEAVKGGELYWPFQGEYWKDELGYYYYSVSDECVATEND